MARFLSVLLGFVLLLSEAASAHGFGEGPGRDLLATETEILPQRKVIVGAVERVFAPDGRSPWHTDHGPKILYLVEGTLAIEGFSGSRILMCGPGPTVCLKQPVAESWYFHNVGKNSQADDCARGPNRGAYEKRGHRPDYSHFWQ